MRPFEPVQCVCPTCGTRCMRVKNRLGGSFLTEVDADGEFLRVHDSAECWSVLQVRDAALRKRLREAPDDLSPVEAPSRRP